MRSHGHETRDQLPCSYRTSAIPEIQSPAIGTSGGGRFKRLTWAEPTLQMTPAPEK